MGVHFYFVAAVAVADFLPRLPSRESSARVYGGSGGETAKKVQSAEYKVQSQRQGVTLDISDESDDESATFRFCRFPPVEQRAEMANLLP
jgi:hypothetical protein